MHVNTPLILHHPLCNVYRSPPGVLRSLFFPSACLQCSITLLEDEMQRLPSVPASHQQECRTETWDEGRRLKPSERSNGKEAFLQGSFLLPPFLIAAGRHTSFKVVCTGSQVGSSLQLLHVMDVLQDHTVGDFPSAWGVMGRRAASMQRAGQQAMVAYS